MRLAQALMMLPQLASDPVIGSWFQGGYYFGKMAYGGNTYWMILAEQASESVLAASSVTPMTQVATSTFDGAANTAALGSGSPSANYCLTYRGGTYADWYLPSWLESVAMYRSFKVNTRSDASPANPYAVPATTAGGAIANTYPLFASGGSQALYNVGSGTDIGYGTSTQTSSSSLNYLRADNAAGVAVSPTQALRVRPIRKVLVGSVPITPQIGDAMGGGYLAGVLKYPTGNQYLIVSDVSAQQSTAFAVNTTADPTDALDGYGNTQTEIANASNRTAAKLAVAFTGGGYTDWYLPAKNELEVMYRNLKPITAANYVDGVSGTNPDSVPVGAPYTATVPAQTTVAAFKTGGAQALANPLWSSTQASSTNGGTEYLGTFDPGLFSSYTKTNTTPFVRPVRKFLTGM